MRLSWDEYGLNLAKAAAQRADCTRRKVGAVILGADHRVKGAGYNGAPPREIGCLSGGCPRGQLDKVECPPYSGYDNCVAIHAEVNAIRHSADFSGGTLYITDAPCADCQYEIADTNLRRVVWPGGMYDV